MPVPFRILLFTCLACSIASAVDFPVGQLIRSDLQDLYNPQIRFGVRYGNYANYQEEQGRPTVKPASNPNSGQVLAPANPGSLFATPNLSTLSDSATAKETKAVPLNLYQVRQDSANRFTTISEVASSAILNGWVAETPLGYSAPIATETLPRVASLPLIPAAPAVPLAPGYAIPSAPAPILQNITNLVLSPIQATAAAPVTITPGTLHTSTQPVVTAATAKGVTLSLGTAITAIPVVIPPSNSHLADLPASIAPNLGEAATPEPSSMFLLIGGLMAGAIWKRRS